MTWEEAIEILDPKTRDEALTEYDCRMRVFAEKEAARLAVSALRSQQAKLDMSWQDGCAVCNKCGVGGLSKLFCNRVEAQYCPLCGRPITKAAWAELERRINGGAVD